MELKNEIFAYVYDWLRMNGYVNGQKDLSAKTGINKNTITNILNGITSVSDKTLHKLNAGFGYMFNMQYLRGLDPYHMLIDDLNNESSEHRAPYIKHQKMSENEGTKQAIEKIKDIDPKDLMAGVENLLQIAATQIKDNDELRRELRESIQELRELITALKAPASKLYEHHTPTVLTVAEPEEKFNK